MAVEKAATDSTQMNGRDGVSMKLYFQKQMAGQIFPGSHSLLTPALQGRSPEGKLKQTARAETSRVVKRYIRRAVQAECISGRGTW